MRRAALFALLAGCISWDNLPDQGTLTLDPLWDPTGAVATEDGLYVPLTHSGGLALLGPGRDPKRVDIGEGRLTRLLAAPDGVTVVAFVETYTCSPEDPRDARGVDTPEDCPGGALEVQTQLSVVRDGQLGARQAFADGSYNRLEFAEDGRFAVAYRDFDDPTLVLEGVINYDAVLVVDLQGEEDPTPVSVGVADQVLFTYGAAGGAEQAVVVSPSSVAIVDLTRDLPDVEVTFPLTLDPDSVVVPVGVSLTPDGRYVLLSIRGEPDLYALDLESQSINIVELGSIPSAMVVNAAHDRTVLVSGAGPYVQVLEHDFFEVDTLALDVPMQRIEQGTNFAFLFDPDKTDAYRLDLAENRVTEYVLANPPTSVAIAPTEGLAIAFTTPRGVGGIQRHGMEVIDLTDDDTENYGLEGTGIGLAFAQRGPDLSALVLQDGVEYVYELDLVTNRGQEVELSSPPVAIGSMPDGTFFITHGDALGLVSFLDPSGEEPLITEVSGFATLGVIDPILLLEEEA